MGVITKDNKFESDVYISSYLIDANSRLKPASFMDLAQESAYLALDAVNIGSEDLRKTNAAWVLARMNIKFLNMPKWREHVKMSTWYRGPLGPFCMRDFTMCDSTGNDLIYASTAWAIIDATSRKMLRGKDIEKVLSSDFICLDSVFSQHQNKVVIPKTLDKELVGQQMVGYKDVDVVGHTNNTRYLAWAMDCLDYNFLINNPLKEVSINFNHETKPGEKVNLYSFSQDNIYYVSGYVEDIHAFSIKMTF